MIKIKVYNQDGTIKAEDIPIEEYYRLIPAGSIVAVHGESFVSWWILAFKEGFASHNEFYLGGGRQQTASAEPRGFILRRLTRYVEKNKPVKIRIYTKADLTVAQLEIMKEKCYALLDSDRGYDFSALAYKAWTSIRDWVRGLFKKGDCEISSLSYEDTGVCCERVVQIYQAIGEWILPTNVSLKESAPRDIDTFILSEEGKKRNYYLSSELIISK